MKLLLKNKPCAHKHEVFLFISPLLCKKIFPYITKCDIINYRQKGSHRRRGRAHQRDSRRRSGLHAKQGVGNLLPAAGALHAGKFFGYVLL